MPVPYRRPSEARSLAQLAESGSKAMTMLFALAGRRRDLNGLGDRFAVALHDNLHLRVAALAMEPGPEFSGQTFHDPLGEASNDYRSAGS